MGLQCEEKILKDIYFHQLNNKNTLQNEDYCATCRTLGLISVVMFVFFLCWQCQVHRISKPVLVFWKAKKKIPFLKKEKRRHNCSLSCTHKKVDHVSGRQGFQSTNSTPFNVCFQRKRITGKKKKRKKNRSTEGYGFQKKKNTFVSKSVAVTYLPNNELLMNFKKMECFIYKSIY